MLARVPSKPPAVVRVSLELELELETNSSSSRARGIKPGLSHAHHKTTSCSTLLGEDLWLWTVHAIALDRPCYTIKPIQKILLKTVKSGLWIVHTQQSVAPFQVSLISIHAMYHLQIGTREPSNKRTLTPFGSMTI
jgi:hypothetical protein